MSNPADLLLSGYLPQPAQQPPQQQQGGPQIMGKPPDPRVALEVIKLKANPKYVTLDDAELLVFATAKVEAEDLRGQGGG